MFSNLRDDTTPFPTQTALTGGPDLLLRSGNGGAVTIRANPGDDDAPPGQLTITGASNFGTGAAGDIVIQSGLADDGTPGHLKLVNLPTSDPGVLDVLWNNAGVINISGY